jgi:hypothetical protein
MEEKYLAQFQKAKAGVELLHIITNQCLTYDELQSELNKFCKYINATSNDKNNRANKSIIAFNEYYDRESAVKRELKTVVEKSRAKKLSQKISYKDYIPEILILKKRGYSLQEISNYCAEHFKVKISKTSVFDLLKKLSAEEK